MSKNLQKINQVSEISVKKHQLSFKWKIKLQDENELWRFNYLRGYLMSKKLNFDEIDVSVQIKLYLARCDNKIKFEILWGGNLSEDKAWRGCHLMTNRKMHSFLISLFDLSGNEVFEVNNGLKDFQVESETATYEFDFKIFYNLIAQTDFIEQSAKTDADKIISKTSSLFKEISEISSRSVETNDANSKADQYSANNADQTKEQSAKEATNSFRSGEALHNTLEPSNASESSDDNSDGFEIIDENDEDGTFKSRDNDDQNSSSAEINEVSREVSVTERADPSVEKTKSFAEGNDEVPSPAKSNDTPDGIEESSSTSNSEDKTPVELKKEQNDRLTRFYRSLFPETTASQSFNQWNDIARLPESVKDFLGHQFFKKVSLDNFGEMLYFADSLQFTLLKQFIISDFVMKTEVMKLFEKADECRKLIQILEQS